MRPELLLEDHALAIQDGRILALAPAAELRARHPKAAVQDLAGQLLIPGLVNAHGHIAMSLLRGYADDLALMDWLQDFIWPIEAALVSPEFVYHGSLLASAEMLMSGTTCFSDMYFFPDAAARATEVSGLRAQFALPIIKFPNAWAGGEQDCIQKALALAAEYRGHDRIHMAFGPHAPYTVTDEGLRLARDHAEEQKLPIQMHLHETGQEITDSLKEHGTRPLARLARLGLLSPRLQAVHMTQVSSEDLELLAGHQVQVVHCPESNMKLASGICPTAELMEHGINVALGTDGAASNNDLDLLGEARTAALLAKLQSGNPVQMNAFEVLEMLTLGGARALGLDAEIGSLEVGKQADCVAVDLSALPQQPVYHPVSQLIYTSSAARVSHVWVGGETLLREGLPTRLNLAEIQEESRRLAAKVRAHKT